MTEAYREIQSLLVTNQTAEARASALRLVQTNAADGQAWFLLSQAFRLEGNLPEAQKAIERALISQPFHPAFHALRGDMYLDNQQWAEAEQALRQAIAAKADYAPALNSLGILCMEMKRTQEAEDLFAAAHTQQPDNPSYLNNLGACQAALGKDAAALRAFESASQKDPGYEPARFGALRLAMQTGLSDIATRHLQYLLPRHPENPELQYFQGKLHQRQGAFAEALTCLQRAASLAPKNAVIVAALADFVWEQGDTEAARDLFQLAETAQPRLETLTRAKLLLPFVHDSEAQMLESRAVYAAGLAQLSESIDEAPYAAATLDAMQYCNFLLAYHGQDDKPLQAQYGRILQRIAQRTPQRNDSPKRIGKEVRRIGIVCNNLYDCTVGRYFGSWITHEILGRHERYVYNGTPVQDAYTNQLLSRATAFRNTSGLPPTRLAELIREDQVDILIFPELGLNPQLFPLGALRSAPIQIAAWGHPVTTGLPEIDYFLSPQSMEPEDAQSQYTEQLIELPGLGTCYEPPSLPPGMERRALGLPENATLYLVPQSVYKIHPANDAVFRQVLQLDANAMLVFFHASRHKVACTKFRQRLRACLHEAGIDVEKRTVFIEQCDHQTYLAINQCADVMLDSLHWSGGNTSLDALSAGLPIITSPGRFMRGRQSMAMLAMLGVPELIVDDPANLAERAVEVARDPAQRQEYSQRIVAGHDQLFRQTDGLHALAAFLSRL